MDTLEHLIALDNTGKFLLVLIVFGILLIIAAAGPVYIYYLRRKDEPRRADAATAHQAVINVDKLAYQMSAVMSELLTIHKSIDSLSVVGPERVIMRLEEIRDRLSSCIGMIESLRRNFEEKE